MFWVDFVVQILKENQYFINCSINSKQAAGKPRLVSITAARTTAPRHVPTERPRRCLRTKGEPALTAASVPGKAAK